MRPKITLTLILAFLFSLLLQGCIVVGPRHPRRCYTDARGRTHCKAAPPRRGHYRHHRR